MSTLTIDGSPSSTDSSFLTRMMDTDSHEMAPIELWGEIFDESVADRMKKADMAFFRRGINDANGMSRPDLTSDEGPVTDESVWDLKGPGAPSAIDLTRRTAVLDQMGIERQIVFPNFGTLGLVLLYHNDPARFFGFDATQVDYRTLGHDIIDAHNRWVFRMSAAHGDRVRPLAILLTESLEQMMTDAQRAIDAGARGFMLSSSCPPADTSPADRALDPFWSLLEDANVAVMLHVGTEFGVISSPRWSANVPEFVSSTHASIEFPMEPYRAAIMHYAPDQYLATMIMGGVFERHPRLRFGVMELMADWVGPLAERLDIIFHQFKKLRNTMSMAPSAYLARNVRVAPYPFEPVEMYMERYPFMRDVLCYSSDFPHVEGGKYSKDVFLQKLSGFSGDVRRKFFVENGELLLPA